MDQTIFRPWNSGHSDRSAGDRARHRQKVREAIKGQIGDIISEEAIITGKKGKILKIPLRGVKEYRFVYGYNKKGIGQGEGNTRPGTVIGKTPGNQKDGNAKQAGNQPGQDYYETEITLEELIEIMFEDLKLPFMERKRLREITAISKRKVVGFRRKGIRPHLSIYRSAVERIKRKQKTKLGAAKKEEAMVTLCAQRRQIMAAQEYLAEQNVSGENLVFLEQKKTTLAAALADISEKIAVAEKELALFYELKSALETKGRDNADQTKGRFPFRDDDLRYRHREEKPRKESNAVVVCIMDDSGSMDTAKKYLARSFFFLLHRFVMTKYENVEIIFIVHDTEAKEVNEDEFFHKGASGGTMMSTGMHKALEIIEQRYHPSLWNIYAFYCSDGENFSSDDDEALRVAEKLCMVANLFGYGEIKPSHPLKGTGGYVDFFKNRIEADNFLSLLISDKDDIWPKFKEFLSVEKEKKA